MGENAKELKPASARKKRWWLITCLLSLVALLMFEGAVGACYLAFGRRGDVGAAYQSSAFTVLSDNRSLALYTGREQAVVTNMGNRTRCAVSTYYIDPSGLLPGYTPLNSVRSTGTQWINTGFSTTTGMVCQYQASWQEPGMVVASYGPEEPWGCNTGYLNADHKWELGFGDGCFQAGNGALNVVYDVKFSTVSGDAYLMVGEDKLLIDDTAQTTTNTFVGILSNAYYQSNATSDEQIAAKATVYRVAIWDSAGIPVRDFQPVLRHSDGMVGLYDHVNSRFYENNGTGNFIAGESLDGLDWFDRVDAPSNRLVLEKGTTYYVYSYGADEQTVEVQSFSVVDFDAGSVAIADVETYYNGQSQKLEMMQNAPEWLQPFMTFEYSQDGMVVDDVVKIGTYQVAVKVYDEIVVRSINLIIMPRPVNVQFTECEGWVYGADRKLPVVSVVEVGSTNVVADKISLRYSYTTLDGVPCPEPDAQTAAGTYIMQVELAPEVVNYQLVGTTTQKFSVQRRTVQFCDIVAADKVYDGNAVATISSYQLNNNLDDTNLVVNFGAVFAQTGVGENIKVTIYDANLAGEAAANYQLAADNDLESTANITPKPVFYDGITARKVYDGSPTVNLDLTGLQLTGPVGNDASALTLNIAGHFIFTNIGTGKAIVLDGAPALIDVDRTNNISKNYQLAESGQQILCGDILPRSIESYTLPSDAVSDKVYDGTTLINVNAEAVVFQPRQGDVGLIPGDALTLTVFAHLAAADAAQQDVVIDRAMLGGSSAQNYHLVATNPTNLTARVFPKDVNYSGLTIEDKIYDGEQTATLNKDNLLLQGVTVADLSQVDLDLMVSFEDATVGSDKNINILGLPSLTGAMADNYHLLTTGNQSLTGNIKPRPITAYQLADGAVSGREYDGTTQIVVDTTDVILTGALPADQGDLGLTVTAVLAAKDAGQQLVLIENASLTGTAAINYILKAKNPDDIMVEITTKEITIAGLQDPDGTGATGNAAIKGVNKEYDRTTLAQVDVSGLVLTGIPDQADVQVAAVGEFVDSEVGDDVAINVTLSLEGLEAANYVLATNTATTTANITKRALTVQVPAQFSVLGEEVKVNSNLVVGSLLEGDEASEVYLLTTNANKDTLGTFRIAGMTLNDHYEVTFVIEGEYVIIKPVETPQYNWLWWLIAGGGGVMVTGLSWLTGFRSNKSKIVRP